MQSVVSGRYISGIGPRALALLPFLLAAGATTAQEVGWVVSQTRGTVLQLVDGHWDELANGDAIGPGRAIRTLQGGQANLTGEAGQVHMGPNTVIALVIENGAIAIQHYSGSMVVAFLPLHGAMIIHAPMATITTEGGIVVVDSTAGADAIHVTEGAAMVALANGSAPFALRPGEDAPMASSTSPAPWTAPAGIDPLDTASAPPALSLVAPSAENVTAPAMSGVGNSPQ